MRPRERSAATFALLFATVLALALLTARPAVAAAPPAGQIAYVHMDYSQGYSQPRDEIWLMNTDGSRAHRLSGYLGRVSDLQWSRDGRRLAFVTQLPDKRPRLWVMNADGSGRREIALVLPTPSGFAVASERIGGLAWAPDNARLAMSCHAAAGQWDPWSDWILLVSVDSAACRVLVGPNDRLAYHALTWSPDGAALVASTSSVVGESSWLTQFNARTGTEIGESLGGGYFTFWSDPAFSPDGRLIACGVTKPVGDDPLAGGTLKTISTVSRDGRVVQDIARSTTDFLRTPSWSPDGQWLVAGAGPDDPLRVVILPAQRNGRQIRTGVYGWHPVWRPVVPPPAPTLKLDATSLVQGDQLRVSGAVPSDGHGAVKKVIVRVGSQKKELNVNASGAFAGTLAPKPGTHSVSAVAVRQGVESARSAAQTVRVQSTSAVLFGLDYGFFSVDTTPEIGRWKEPLTSKGWTPNLLNDGTAMAALPLIEGKGLLVFAGHGVSIRAGDGSVYSGFVLELKESRLTTTRGLKELLGGSGGVPVERWRALEEVDLSALRAAVYAGCSTGVNSGRPRSLLGYTVGAGAAVAVGFGRTVHSLIEERPWLDRFRDYTLEDGLDVTTAAYRAEQDWAIFGSIVVAKQKNPGKRVFINEAPAAVRDAHSKDE